jgi:V-containing nitrogenase delta subunit
MTNNTEIMSDKVDDLFGYVQERCLWQFYSRSWDRTENIDGILAQATGMFIGKALETPTPQDRYFMAEAKIMVADCLSRFPWLKSASEQEIRELMSELHTRLTDIAITSSKNHELTHTLY